MDGDTGFVTLTDKQHAALLMAFGDAGSGIVSGRSALRLLASGCEAEAVKSAVGALVCGDWYLAHRALVEAAAGGKAEVGTSLLKTACAYFEARVTTYERAFDGLSAAIEGHPALARSQYDMGVSTLRVEHQEAADLRDLAWSILGQPHLVVVDPRATEAGERILACVLAVAEAESFAEQGEALGEMKGTHHGFKQIGAHLVSVYTRLTRESGGDRSLAERAYVQNVCGTFWEVWNEFPDDGPARLPADILRVTLRKLEQLRRRICGQAGLIAYSDDEEWLTGLAGADEL